MFAQRALEVCDGAHRCFVMKKVRGRIEESGNARGNPLIAENAMSGAPGTHPRCDDLVFFVYDPDAFIPDQRALREAIEIERAYGKGGERRLRCHLIVKP
jgi:hypothetical protein